jgi:phosphoserine aminotransferase
MKKHNFSAGPCILPQEVLIQASKAVLNFNNSNLSLIEISHRSKDFVEVMEKAQRLVKELLDLPKGYSVLFLQGGASTQFLMSCMNLLKTNGSAAYINTGTWSDKAIKEAEKFGEINVIGSSQDKNYSYIPKNLNCPEEMDYLHFTSNNTIFGTQFQDFPIVSANTLLVCDMSSDIFSRKFNISKFDLIYAGAQKNMGPAGTTLVIVKDEILQQTGRDIPSMLDYSIHIKKKSMFNTPPVFPIYVSMLNLEWLKNNGGVEWIEQINKQKAELLYNEIDQNYLFEGVAAKEDRSKMNVTFILTDKSKEEEFDRAWHNAGINGLKGHRSVGGYRASIYNALPLSSVQILVDVMHNL